MTNLINFDFESKNVRVIMIDNNPWFLANDVCSILEYTNSRKAVSDHCKPKGVTKRDTLLCDVTKRDTSSKARKEQTMTYINEPNLYRLIIRSKMEAAEKFEEHVFEVILPAIRKTGSYSLTINTEQQYEIKKAVSEKSFETGIHYRTIYTMLYDEFKIPRYDELLAKSFDKAITFIKSIGKVIKTSQDKLHESRVFAVALMNNGLKRYFEVDHAHYILENKLADLTEQLRTLASNIWEVKTSINHISRSSGAMYDGLAEARTYLFLDKQVYKDANQKVKEIFIPMDLKRT